MRTADNTRTYRGEILSLASPEILEYARYELSRRRSIQIRMSGSSMRPIIEDGDFVTIAPIDATTLDRQDIVLIVTSQRTALIHRIVSLETRGDTLYALTRGDRSQYTDTPVSLTQVMGRVVSVRRKGRGRVIAVRRPPTFWDHLRGFLHKLRDW